MKQLFVLLLFLTTFPLSAQEITATETENTETVKTKSIGKEIDYDKTGVIVSVSAFNYFSNYEKYNCHEIVLQIYPINRFKKAKKP
ncbi:MAG: hypothetical protein Ta2A_19260 [Treponemataceae bacterium]|nr:MAG: hypothetical protein Ta2A_19260 [Treponemataceae bacterium]